MRKLLVLLLLGLVPFSGCLGDDDGDDGDDGDGDGNGDGNGDDDMQELPDQLEFSFGPSLGCEGSTVGPETCLSFLAGPAASGIDGFWLELSEDYWGLSLSTTIASATGDSDCYFVDSGMAVIADGHAGGGPCSGRVPDNTAYLFLYSYLEPQTGMTATFSA